MTTQPDSMSAIDFLIFMEHPVSLSSIADEYYTIVPRQEVKALSSSNQTMNEEQEHSCMRIIRFLHCRVKLSGNRNVLNANYVDGYEHKRKYIYTKSPCANNVDEYLQMMWDKNVEIIVVPSRSENDVNFHQYWSPNEGAVIEYDNFKIETLEVTTKPQYILTLLILTNRKGRIHRISHFEYTAWPVYSICHDLRAFLDFVSNINEQYTYLEKHKPSRQTRSYNCAFASMVTIAQQYFVYLIPVLQNSKRRE
ncbi:PTP 4 [Bracoviriform demolitoris]|uniref:Tyrosine phosphatase-like protein J3 n=1 Tax=Microplitis demolitor bracovirus (isolate Webb) TaxID=654919 RepID=PTPJ3_MDBVW|nr:PTP 4 [Bracoviriform demolitoris]Q5I138.1 RecName: Full=Tyrosine phosphatase-like protein J3; Short=PTP-J3 [Microplitis demolitor bracovirus (isolate Webb)]AAW51792.1 PTP 4 [Bracoviriform demolitoris]